MDEHLEDQAHVDVAWLKVHQDNPRWIKEERMEDLLHSMREDPLFLEARPLLALPDGQVIAGNQRLKAARALGMTSIPCRVVHLSPERVQQWMVKDNVGYGEFDRDGIGAIIFDLQSSNADLRLTGLEESEIDRILASMDAGDTKDPEDRESGGGVTEEEFQRISRGEPINFGRHRLMYVPGWPDLAEVRRVHQDGEYSDLLVASPHAELLEKESDEDEASAHLGVLADRLRRAGSIYLHTPGGRQAGKIMLGWSSLWRLFTTLTVVHEYSESQGGKNFQLQHSLVWFGMNAEGVSKQTPAYWGGEKTSTTIFNTDAEVGQLDPDVASELILSSSERGGIVFCPFDPAGAWMEAINRTSRCARLIVPSPDRAREILGRYR